MYVGKGKPRQNLSSLQLAVLYEYKHIMTMELFDSCQ